MTTFSLTGSSRSRLRTLMAAAVVALVVAPLCMAGVPFWAQSVTMLVALAVLWVAVVARSKMAVPFPALIPLAGVVFTLLQLIPLPPEVLGLFSPEAEGLRKFVLAPLGVTGWRPITLDVPGSCGALALSASTFGLCVASYSGAAVSRTFRTAARVTVGGVGVLLVAMAIVHWALQLDALFGFLPFRYGAPRLVTPFNNNNNLAGYLLLSSTLLLGLALSVRERSRRVLWLGAAAATSVGVILTYSRAGTLTLILALSTLVVVLLTATQGISAEARARTARFGAGLLIVAIVTGVLFREPLTSRFSDTASASAKVAFWPEVMNAVGDYWRAGMGRGAFVYGFTHYFFSHLGKTYTHPENALLQWLAEFGVLGAAVLVSLVMWSAFLLVRNTERAAQPLATTIALFAIATHNLFDFSLERPALALTSAVLLGVASSDAQMRAFRVPPALTATVITVLALVGLRVGRSDRDLSEVELVDLQAATTPEEVHERLLAIIAKHPADAVPYGAAAARLLTTTPAVPREALSLATRALYLYPNDWAGHLTAARALRMLGSRKQVLLEYREAWVIAPNADPILLEAVEFAAGADEIETLVPSSAHYVEQLVTVLLQAKRFDEAARVALVASEQAKDAPTRESFVTLTALVWAQSPKPERARPYLEGLSPEGKVSPRALHAQALLADSAGDVDGGIAALTRALEAKPSDYQLAVTLAQRLIASKRFDAAHDLITKAANATSDSYLRANLSALDAEALQGRHQPILALEALARAARLDPRSHRRAQLAEAERRVGRLREAIGSLRSAIGLETHGPTIEAMQRELEAWEAEAMDKAPLR